MRSSIRHCNYMLQRSCSRFATSSSIHTKRTATPLEGDAGALATHIHHGMTTLLVVATPLYLLIPSSTSGIVDKIFGSALAITMAGHSWIGLNYVATDYVPKISKSLLGPARIVNAIIGAVTLVGLGTIAFNNQGGIKGCLSGLWGKSGKNKAPTLVE
jgi:succinate dehydrogenase hydrophobic anchor subunit